MARCKATYPDVGVGVAAAHGDCRQPAAVEVVMEVLGQQLRIERMLRLRRARGAVRLGSLPRRRNPVTFFWEGMRTLTSSTPLHSTPLPSPQSRHTYALHLASYTHFALSARSPSLSLCAAALYLRLPCTHGRAITPLHLPT